MVGRRNAAGFLLRYGKKPMPEDIFVEVFLKMLPGRRERATSSCRRTGFQPWGGGPRERRDTNFTDEPRAAKPQPLWSARTCPRFRQATCRRRMGEGVQLFRAAGRGPALATSRQSGQSGDKSPHSRFWPAAQTFIIAVRMSAGMFRGRQSGQRPLKEQSRGGELRFSALD